VQRFLLPDELGLPWAEARGCSSESGSAVARQAVFVRYGPVCLARAPSVRAVVSSLTTM